MHRLLPALVLSVVVALAVGASPAAAAKGKAKPKPFKPRTYVGTLVTTSPGVTSSEKMTINVRKGRCGDGRSAKRKRGVCFKTSWEPTYLAPCTAGGGLIADPMPVSIVADYLLPASGRMTFRTSSRSSPPSAPSELDHTVEFRITTKKIAGTATFRSTNGVPTETSWMACQGTATFELKRTT